MLDWYREPVWPISDTRSVAPDTDERKISGLRAGRVPIFEPGLSELVLTNQCAQHLVFTNSLREAGRGARAIFIAVGTPSLAEV
jgi:UDPglucose 6-dehydrogenase